MCGLGLVLVAPLVGLMATGDVRAATGAEELAPVDVVEVSGLIDSVVAQNIEESIIRSQSNGAQALILQMNSKGAVISRERMTELATAIADSAIPVAIWVGPSGSRALGLPAQLLAIADVTAMAPGARVGRTGRQRAHRLRAGRHPRRSGERQGAVHRQIGSHHRADEGHGDPAGRGEEDPWRSDQRGQTGHRGCADRAPSGAGGC